MARTFPDRVADCVLSTFASLPAKYKPRALAPGSREWVPLSGIVLSKGNGERLTCAGLATGMKCLPASKIFSANGIVLHDSHAEVLAIRAFNRFLIDECSDLAARGFSHSNVAPDSQDDIAWQSQSFAIQEDVQIHMYTSEAPCGDCSMELTMAAQTDATPWTLPSSSTDVSQQPLASHPEAGLTEQSTVMRGRGYFSELGVVRMKPSRSDAPISLSKSCSDKLARKQCTSLLSSLTSLLINPAEAYLSTLILPESQYRWQATGYQWKPFDVRTTSREFEYSRRSGPQCAKLVPSNLSCVWTARFQEALIGGVLQGRRSEPVPDPRGASSVCRRRMWQAVSDVAESLAEPALITTTRKRSYSEVKRGGCFGGREGVKRDLKVAALPGWIDNVGDEQWGLAR
ncbi:adenosine deaminase/editase [Cryomyces antarcticus]